MMIVPCRFCFPRLIRTIPRTHVFRLVLIFIIRAGTAVSLVADLCLEHSTSPYMRARKILQLCTEGGEGGCGENPSNVECMGHIYCTRLLAICCFSHKTETREEQF